MNGAIQIRNGGVVITRDGKVATAEGCCDCGCEECPVGLLNAYALAGFRDGVAFHCTLDRSVPDGPCEWGGDLFRNSDDADIGDAGLIRDFNVFPCGFLLALGEGESVRCFKAGDVPTGSYPNVTVSGVAFTGLNIT
jgi:hypothetical protein